MDGVFVDGGVVPRIVYDTARRNAIDRNKG